MKSLTSRSSIRGERATANFLRMKESDQASSWRSLFDPLPGLSINGALGMSNRPSSEHEFSRNWKADRFVI